MRTQRRPLARLPYEPPLALVAALAATVWLASCDAIQDLGSNRRVQDAGTDAADADASSAPTCEGGDCTSGTLTCDGLLATCGPAASTSCCASAVVPGGTFYRSYDGVTNTNRNFPATLSDFRMDLYEVTVGRFRTFVVTYPSNRPTAGTGKNPRNPNDQGWDAAWNGLMPADRSALEKAVKCNTKDWTWTDLPAGNENRPITCVTWYEAYAFCIWDGGRLATEAEWNYAAAGGSEQRVFPWSAPPTSQTINETYASYRVDETRKCFGDGVAGCTLRDLLEVGTKPAGNGRWGHADLAGNVVEWVQDGYATYANPCVDCANTTDIARRVARSGGYADSVAFMLTADRDAFSPTERGSDLGIRCVRSP